MKWEVTKVIRTKMSRSTYAASRNAYSKWKWSVQETNTINKIEPPKGCASDPTFIFSVAPMPRQDIPFRLTAQTTYQLQHHQPPRSTNNNRSSPMSAQAKNALLQQVRMKYSRIQWHPILAEKLCGSYYQPDVSTGKKRIAPTGKNEIQ